MGAVRAKKHLGQHFLVDKNIAAKIALMHAEASQCQNIVEIGPGMGILTSQLMQLPDKQIYAIEIDKESVAFLKENFPNLAPYIIEADFLKYDMHTLLNNQDFEICGNFPYNISGPIMFRLFFYRNKVQVLTGMFQREVARRIVSGPGSKEYGILSVLIQIFYDVEILFPVSEHVFQPKPKVQSAVIQCRRNAMPANPDFDVEMLVKIVKAAFNQRRKTMRNSLNVLFPKHPKLQDDFFLNRPEQIPPAAFIDITRGFSVFHRE